MNLDQLEGKWTQLVGHAKEKWGELTDDELTVVAGQYDKLVGKLQERYGYEKERAEKEINEWLSKY